MKAEILPSMPPSFKTNVSNLNPKFGLADVKESSEERDATVHTQTKAVSNPSQAGGPVKQNHTSEDVTEGPSKQTVRIKPNRRSQSKRTVPNGRMSQTESPPSTSTNSPPRKPTPPKNVSNLSQLAANKTIATKSRERSWTETSADSKERSYSPPRNQHSRVRGLQISKCQPRRRVLSSRSEDFSSSSGDLQSPRSVSDRLMSSVNGTLSPDSSDDPRQFTHLPASPSPAGYTASPSPGGYTAFPSPTNPWDFFEEHVRNIQDSGDMFSRHQGPSFQASSTFQETMVEIYGYPDYTQPPSSSSPGIQNVAARGLLVAGAANRFLKLRKRNTTTGLGPDEAPVVDRETVENAKRGWRVLKEYVRENYSSKRTSQAALSWSMLRHTLKGLSDREKTRIDLYRRYGIIPTVDGEGKLVKVNTMLSERARRAIANGSRHPLLAHGAKVHFQPAADKSLSSPSLSATFSSSSSSPRLSSSSESSQRRPRRSVVHSAHADMRPLTSVNGSRQGGVPLRNGLLRQSTEALSSH